MAAYISWITEYFSGTLRKLHPTTLASVASEHYVISDTVSTSRAKEWNALCAGKTGDDYTSVRAVMN